jgi:hypothetical protein
MKCYGERRSVSERPSNKRLDRVNWGVYLSRKPVPQLALGDDLSNPRIHLSPGAADRAASPVVEVCDLIPVDDDARSIAFRAAIESPAIRCGAFSHPADTRIGDPNTASGTALRRAIVQASSVQHYFAEPPPLNCRISSSYDRTVLRVNQAPSKAQVCCGLYAHNPVVYCMCLVLLQLRQIAARVVNMRLKIRSEERQQLADIFHEEIEAARKRITERLKQYEEKSGANKGDSFDAIRRFYEDLADTSWTHADEETLAKLAAGGESEIKRLMREGFRRLRVHPVPSFASLINALKKHPGEPVSEEAVGLPNRDAVPSADRERIANVLHRELDEAARAITSRLRLADAKTELVREQLESVEGAVISEFTPLV